MSFVFPKLENSLNLHDYNITKISKILLTVYSKEKFPVMLSTQNLSVRKPGNLVLCRSLIHSTLFFTLNHSFVSRALDESKQQRKTNANYAEYFIVT